MLTIKIKIKEKDSENSKVELIQPSKKELDSATKIEKNTTAVIYNIISEALQNAQDAQNK